MSPFILLILGELLCIHCIAVFEKPRMVIDKDDPSSIPLLCGSEVLIEHRGSGLCLSMTKNRNNAHLMQIDLQLCYELDRNQRWKLHCCDPYMLRCGRYNPLLGEGDTITYSDYFQIQQMESKLCISSANLWEKGTMFEPKSVYLQQCQPSLMDSMDTLQSTKIQRDKFLFNDGEDDSGTPVHSNHFLFLINVFVPLCLGQEPGTDYLVSGYPCEVHTQDKVSVQFKFFPLDSGQNNESNDALFDEL